ncbi:hypothetical protein ACFL4J_01445 [Candidatus Margulisiibacteriota bacterium]
MKIFLTLLSLILLCVPTLARPYQYNAAYGPEYFYFSSSRAGTSADLVTCGLVCSGNIFERLNAEFRGGVGEISNTRISYNEISILYLAANGPDRFFGIGPSFLSYENILDKSSSAKIDSQELNAKICWAQGGLYCSAVGPTTVSYDLGWLAYFDEYLGDFNLRLGYKDIKFKEGSSMKGPYIASSVYF